MFRCSVALVLLFALGLSACSDSSTDGGIDDEFQLAAVVQALTAESGTVTTQVGSPDSDLAAPTPQVEGGTAMIPGGGSGYRITTDSDFSVLYVMIQGLQGFYEISYGSPRNEAEVVLAYAEELEDADYTFEFAVGTGTGAGMVESRTLPVIAVGTGEVQVSVSWDQPSDVDLYVVDPSGEEIFYGNRTSGSGGQLDLDSNAACGGQDVRNENITWPDGSAPSGDYQVRVNYWDSCGVDRTSWVVTVRVEGEPVRTFTGEFTGPGNQGASGAGQFVTTFSR